MQRQHCFLARFSDRACDGRMDRAHWLPKQRLKRELKGQPPELVERAVWHPACWVWACRRHHGDFDAHVFRVARADLPAGVEVFAEALGVGWMLDWEFGALERVASAHERVACPKCRAPVGSPCWHMGYRSVPHNISRSPLKRPHAERLQADEAPSVAFRR